MDHDDDDEKILIGKNSTVAAAEVAMHDILCVVFIVANFCKYIEKIAAAAHISCTISIVCNIDLT